ncbi:CyP450 monooxygenase [Trametes versicolor FP-101664 SS1]|uniref:CyP450 monooxygenase n=1 Tax=Trametes versicolor (strain FP-101664) TaxID=717944 RepID=UPI00046236AC|nr:CyP450 monooxygenase [Trametes versicolor FP-101664 SS1]EIW59176.1 CyP450 monooxygenase [Trametes versicolor FP-101664 SS1]
MLDVPKYKPWIAYRDISRTYGEIAYLNVIGQPILVLGNHRVVIDYLDKRSRITSDRSDNVVVELSGQDVNFGAIRYGDWWRRHRRVFWQQFHPGVVTKYNTVQSDYAHRFLARLIQSPSQVTHHIKFSLSGILLKITYGIDIADEHDQYLAMIKAAFVAIDQSTPGHFAVEMFPFLRFLPSWFPGAGSLKLFAECRAANLRLRDVTFDGVKEAAARGETRECIAATLLARAGRELGPADEDILRNVCSILLSGGTDTSSSVLSAFFVAMALYPEVQRRAQAELESVVGPHRLPEYSDSPDLVYVNALIKELLRWHLVLPLGVPHFTLEDDEFHGYFIPAGTVLITNLWCADIMHDPEAYDDPDEFRPERFIRDGKLDPTVRDPNAFIFGFGRRICPGRYFAHISLFLHIACALHVFDIGPPLDEDGRPLKIKYEQSHGLVSKPEDCRCTIRPRSRKAEELILKAQSKAFVPT